MLLLFFCYLTLQEISFSLGCSSRPQTVLPVEGRVPGGVWVCLGTAQCLFLITSSFKGSGVFLFYHCFLPTRAEHQFTEAVVLPIPVSCTAAPGTGEMVWVWERCFQPRGVLSLCLSLLVFLMWNSYSSQSHSTVLLQGHWFPWHNFYPRLIILHLF